MALAELIVVMNRGRVEQQGNPQEIFSRPATEFVARFIGGHNIIRSAGGLLALRTDRVRIGRLNGQAPRAAACWRRCAISNIRARTLRSD
jgi:putative spermidine/putrescine transport system ATP-binding protein